MALYHTILHPTDFDTPSVEAFRVSRALAQQMGARVIAFHVAASPAVITEDGRVILDPKEPTPVDLWESYRAAQADTPGVKVEHSMMVGNPKEATNMLMKLIGQHDPGGVLIVMGTHGRSGLSRLIWGNKAEEIVRTAPCAVLVVREPAGS